MAEPDEILIHSLRSLGPLHPVYVYENAVLDGSRRLRFCHSFGIAIGERVLRTREEAAPVLWRLHPDRCVARFPERSPMRAAELYQCELRDVVKYMIAPEPYQRREPGRRTGERGRISSLTDGAKQVNVRMNPQLWERFKLVARDNKIDPADLLRAAVYHTTREPAEAIAALVALSIARR